MTKESKESSEQKPKNLIQELGEFGLISHLNQGARQKNESTVKGIGDDAAVISNGSSQTVISTDLLLEGIHFDLIYTPLKHLGYKAVVVNISDILAMNATPQQITVSIGVSSKFPTKALEDLYEGIHLACKNYEVDLIGGDTSSSLTGLLISVTAIGYAEKEDIVYRNTAKAGDYICVSGNLGAAYLGLQLLEREKEIYLENPKIQPDLEDQEYLVGRLLRPEARMDIIDLLRKFNIKPTSMIDISDGLSSDILHICTQSGVGCRLHDENIPLHPQTYVYADKFLVDPLTCALSGGEDYELLFTIDPKDYDELSDMDGLAIIGRITEKKDGYKIWNKSGSTHDLKAQGWNHI